MENIEAIAGEYLQVLTAMDICQARPFSARRLARPRRPHGEDGAIRIDTGADTAKQRLEETRLLSRLMQLEAMYGGDPEDLRRLVASVRATPPPAPG